MAFSKLNVFICILLFISINTWAQVFQIEPLSTKEQDHIPSQNEFTTLRNDSILGEISLATEWALKEYSTSEQFGTMLSPFGTGNRKARQSYNYIQEMIERLAGDPLRDKGIKVNLAIFSSHTPNAQVEMNHYNQVKYEWNLKYNRDPNNKNRNLQKNHPDYKEFPLKTLVQKSTDGNYYHLYVTAGLLNLVKTEAELAFIIAHELSHLLQGHLKTDLYHNYLAHYWNSQITEAVTDYLAIELMVGKYKLNSAYRIMTRLAKLNPAKTELYYSLFDASSSHHYESVRLAILQNKVEEEKTNSSKAQFSEDNKVPTYLKNKKSSIKDFVHKENFRDPQNALKREAVNFKEIQKIIQNNQLSEKYYFYYISELLKYSLIMKNLYSLKSVINYIDSLTVTNSTKMNMAILIIGNYLSAYNSNINHLSRQDQITLHRWMLKLSSGENPWTYNNFVDFFNVQSLESSSKFDYRFSSDKYQTSHFRTAQLKSWFDKKFWQNFSYWHAQHNPEWKKLINNIPRLSTHRASKAYKLRSAINVIRSHIIDLGERDKKLRAERNGPLKKQRQKADFIRGEGRIWKPIIDFYINVLEKKIDSIKVEGFSNSYNDAFSFTTYLGDLFELLEKYKNLKGSPIYEKIEQLLSPKKDIFLTTRMYHFNKAIGQVLKSVKNYNKSVNFKTITKVDLSFYHHLSRLYKLIEDTTRSDKLSYKASDFLAIKKNIIDLILWQMNHYLLPTIFNSSFFELGIAQALTENHLSKENRTKLLQYFAISQRHMRSINDNSPRAKETKHSILSAVGSNFSYEELLLLISKEDFIRKSIDKHAHIRRKNYIHQDIIDEKIKEGSHLGADLYSKYHKYQHIYLFRLDYQIAIYNILALNPKHFKRFITTTDPQMFNKILSNFLRLKREHYSKGEKGMFLDAQLPPAVSDLFLATLKNNLSKYTNIINLKSDIELLIKMNESIFDYHPAHQKAVENRFIVLSKKRSSAKILNLLRNKTFLDFLSESTISEIIFQRISDRIKNENRSDREDLLHQLKKQYEFIISRLSLKEGQLYSYNQVKDLFEKSQEDYIKMYRLDSEETYRKKIQFSLVIHHPVALQKLRAKITEHYGLQRYELEKVFVPRLNQTEKSTGANDFIRQLSAVASLIQKQNLNNQLKIIDYLTGRRRDIPHFLNQELAKLKEFSQKHKIYETLSAIRKHLAQESILNRTLAMNSILAGPKGITQIKDNLKKILDHFIVNVSDENKEIARALAESMLIARKGIESLTVSYLFAQKVDKNDKLSDADILRSLLIGNGPPGQKLGQYLAFIDSMKEYHHTLVDLQDSVEELDNLYVLKLLNEYYKKEQWPEHLHLVKVLGVGTVNVAVLLRNIKSGELEVASILKKSAFPNTQLQLSRVKQSLYYLVNETSYAKDFEFMLGLLNLIKRSMILEFDKKRVMKAQQLAENIYTGKTINGWKITTVKAIHADQHTFRMTLAKGITARRLLQQKPQVYKEAMSAFSQFEKEMIRGKYKDPNQLAISNPDIHNGQILIDEASKTVTVIDMGQAMPIAEKDLNFSFKVLRIISGLESANSAQKIMDKIAGRKVLTRQQIHDILISDTNQIDKLLRLVSQASLSGYQFKLEVVNIILAINRQIELGHTLELNSTSEFRNSMLVQKLGISINYSGKFLHLIDASFNRILDKNPVAKYIHTRRKKLKQGATNKAQTVKCSTSIQKTN